MIKLNDKEILEIIEKILNCEGSDSEQDQWMQDIKNSVPYYSKIIDLLFWNNEKLTATEILERAKKEHSPIIL